MFVTHKGVKKVDHFQAIATTGAISAGIAGASEILQIRWTSTAKLCAIHSLKVNGMYATTAFAAGAIDLNATIARAFTAAGTGGGTVTLTTNNNKMQTDFATSVMGEIRVATTAALTAGTKTLDATTVGSILTHSSGGVGSATPIIGSIYLPKLTLFEADTASVQHPIVLEANEGLIVRCTVPATGVWTIGFELKWAEVVEY